MTVQEMRKDKSGMIPDKGFNLVGLDDYEDPGEQLYLIKNFASRAEAEKEMRKRQKTGNGDKLFIYGPTDR